MREIRSTITRQQAESLQRAFLSLTDYPARQDQMKQVAANLTTWMHGPLTPDTAQYCRAVLDAWKRQDYSAMQNAHQ